MRALLIQIKNSLNLLLILLQILIVIIVQWKYVYQLSLQNSNKAQQMDANMITVNNFFGHWFTDIDIRHYPDDMTILPTNNTVNIYEHSNAQMKYLPEKSVKKLLKTMLYSNKPVYLAENVDRRPNNDNDNNKRSDPNLTYCIAQLRNYILEKMLIEFH